MNTNMPLSKQYMLSMPLESDGCEVVSEATDRICYPDSSFLEVFTSDYPLSDKRSKCGSTDWLIS